MKLYSKSEYFELDSPIGEPEIEWKTGCSYLIERVTKPDGEVIWFGQGTNWVKKPGEGWTKLGEDESVKPKVFIKGENGKGDYSEYPEGRFIFLPCEEPIYETLYRNL